TSEVKVEVVHRGVGAITDSDVLLAKASNAIIIGFHVRPDSNARASAERERVEIRTYRIIYEAVEEVKAAMEGLLAPEKKEVVVGEAEVRQTFKIAKVGTIAGCFVRSGVIPRTARVRVIRDGVEVYEGTIASLNRFNVSAAETAHHDLWQRAELTVCVVSNERGHAESVLREADRLVAGAAGARIVDTSTSYL